jgi:hypothetical protein
MKKIFLILIGLLVTSISIASNNEDTVIVKFNQMMKRNSSKYKFYKPIKTYTLDSARVVIFKQMDTLLLSRVYLFEKIFPSRKMYSSSVEFNAKLLRKINKNLIDKEILSYYDTLKPSFSQINLVDTSLKYNKIEIDDSLGITFRIFHVFQYYNRDEMPITDTTMYFYTPKNIRYISNASFYKKGFNYLGTIKNNKEILKEEYDKIFENLKNKQD